MLHFLPRCTTVRQGPRGLYLTVEEDVGTKGKNWKWSEAAGGRQAISDHQRKRHAGGEVIGRPFEAKHGWGGTPTYNSWKKMRQRCMNPKHPDYRIYGGRGIRVCDRWLNDVCAFVEDMGVRPPGRYSLERVDVNGDYCPENCVWLPMAYQAKNRTNWRHTEDGRARIAAARLGTKRVYAEDGSWTYTKH